MTAHPVRLGVAADGETEAMTNSFNAFRRAAKPPERRAEPKPFDEEFAQQAEPAPGDLPVFEEIARAVSGQPPPAAAAAISPGSHIAEEFRILGAKLRAIGEQRPARCVGLVSATGGEGKTTAALGLATALAQEPGRRVLLIEADLRRPTIDGTLGLERVDGLAEWLEAAPGAVPLRRLMPQGFSLLSAGRSVAPRPELLGTARMARLLEAARRSFDFVVVDCPPLAPVADSVVMQDMVDGFLFVVRVRHSPLEVIQRALSHVKPERIFGVVLNDHRELLRSYYSYGYKYYGRSR